MPWAPPLLHGVQEIVVPVDIVLARVGQGTSVLRVRYHSARASTGALLADMSVEM